MLQYNPSMFFPTSNTVRPQPLFQNMSQSTSPKLPPNLGAIGFPAEAMNMLSSWVPVSKSIWDFIPTKVKQRILSHTDPLTRYLNNDLTGEEVDKYGSEIWRIAIETESDGDLINLAAKHFPTIKTGLDLVKSKEMYIRLCTIRPDLLLTGHLQNMVRPMQWAWKVKSRYSLNSMLQFHLERLVDALSNLLIHIPLREEWLEMIPVLLKNDKVILFCIAACFGHGRLLRSLLKDKYLQNHNDLPLAATISLKYSIKLRYDYAGYDDALFFAAANGHAEVVKLLLSVDGLDIDIDVDMDGETVLCHAAEHGHLDIIKILLDAGADATALNNNALTSSAENGHLEVANADANSPIRRAAHRGRTEVVKLLLETEGVDYTDDDYDATLGAAENGHLETLKLLLANGGDPTPRNNYALRMAAAKGYTEVVKFLLETEVVDASEHDNEAIKKATANGHADVVKLLLSANGVDPTVEITIRCEWQLNLGDLRSLNFYWGCQELIPKP
ncbi:hypothetical protein HDU76_002085 [Blyttiomyces sp. JEL0837]|nr:hypothetical protein HDU76_002085 [Blyttiomyces sp. JEL0837]